MLRAALVDEEEQGTVKLLNLLGWYCREALGSRCWSEIRSCRADKEERWEEVAGLKLGLLKEKIYSQRAVENCYFDTMQMCQVFKLRIYDIVVLLF